MAQTAGADACTPLQVEMGDQRASQSRNSKSYGILLAFVLGMMVATIALLAVQHYGLGDTSFTRFFFASELPPVQPLLGTTGTSVGEQVPKDNFRHFGRDSEFQNPTRVAPPRMQYEQTEIRTPLPRVVLPVVMQSRLPVLTPSAVVIRRQVGQLGFETETEWEYHGEARNPLDPSKPARTVEMSGISVRLFEATLSGGERILVKEFPAPAIDMAEQELAVYEYLEGFTRAPGGIGIKGGTPQVITLLGSLRTDQFFERDAFREQWLRALPSTPPPAAGELWLIFRWERIKTVASFPRAPQQRSWCDFDGRAARSARKKFLKVLAAQALQAVSWLHGKGIVHRSLSSSSLILSTYDQEAPERLFLKVIDLGFASSASMLPPTEIASAMARGASSPLDVFPYLTRFDLHQLAYVLLEVFLASAVVTDAGNDRGRPTDVQTLTRLVEDIFEGDVMGQFRNYVVEEPQWKLAAELLDEKERAGWDLMQQLISCRYASSEEAKKVSAQALLESPWFLD